MRGVFVKALVGRVGHLWLRRVGVSWLVLSFWLPLHAGVPAGPWADDGLLPLLPPVEDLEGWRPEGPPQSVEGEGLFSVIDGGAEVFLKAGFERAVFQTYSDLSGRLVFLELYEMKGPSSAEKIYAHKAEGGGSPEEMGDAATRGDHYILFRHGRFLVTVTGADSRAETMGGVLAIGRAVESRIRKASR